MIANWTRANILGKSVMKTFVRNGSHGGIPGENLPFSLKSRGWLTFNFFWYTLTGVGAPFVLLVIQMNKK